MASGNSKQAMDKAQIVTPDGLVVAVESIEAKQARTKLWGRINNYVRVAVEQVMDMINGVLPGYDQTEMADVLQFSAEHCAAVLDKADEPIDEPASWAAYDSSVKLIDILTMIPYQWEKHLDPDFWKLPPLEKVPHAVPIGRKDFDRLKQMPKKHLLHMDHLPQWEPKYRIPA